ncbi:type II CAAX prenyl endopeptidase Rce1 family protein [Haladaptatus sp.]|uniref:CPBP family glutamic-type intramembrane protease n=1 Tax=Haladaptatus sp. TaxID=1973141 RepID=UPI003C67E92D
MNFSRNVEDGSFGLSWVQLTFLVGGIITVSWSYLPSTGGSLNLRVIRDTTLYILIPGVLAITHGRHLGYRVDRKAVRNTLILAAFVIPIYVVGSSLPTIRTYYPMWETSAALGNFLPHSVKQFIVVLAAETYYRGFLCVGLRKIGYKSAFVSPVIYAFHHLGKPPIEVVLSAPTDVLFGVVDFNCDSLLPSVVAHGVGLMLLDWLVLHKPLIPPETVVHWLSWIPVHM